MQYALLMYLLYIFRQASRTSWPATSYVKGHVVQWTTCLTMNQKIAGSSHARIDRVLCGKDRLVWQADQLQLMSEVLWRNGQWLYSWSQLQINSMLTLGRHNEGSADSLYPLSPARPAPPSYHQQTRLHNTEDSLVCWWSSTVLHLRVLHKESRKNLFIKLQILINIDTDKSPYSFLFVFYTSSSWIIVTSGKYIKTICLFIKAPHLWGGWQSCNSWFSICFLSVSLSLLLYWRGKRPRPLFCR